MSIPESIFAVLGADNDLGDLVSTRISPYVRNANTQAFPAVVFEVADTEIESDSSGTVAHCISTLTVSCIARTFSGADEVAAQVLTTLAAYSSATYCINLITPTSISRDQDDPYDGSQTLVYKTNINFSIDHGEAI